MYVTSSNQASNEVIKKLRLSLTRKRFVFSTFHGDNHQTIINSNVSFAWMLQYHYQIVRKLSISPNWSTGSLPEVKVRKVKLTFSDESTYKCWCFLSYLILFIISGVTWLNDNKNLPIVSWNSFCELLVYVTCNTSNWSSEGTDFSYSHFETNWSSDRKLEKNRQ